MTYQDVFAGYEARKEQLRAWAQRHYIEEFGLTGSLLDVGCGNGFWSGLFAEAGLTVEGFDEREDLIAEARVKHPDLWFWIDDATLPLDDVGQFDTVFARTLPQFYAPTLDDFRALAGNLLPHVAIGGTLLFSAYTDQSGEDRPTLAAGVARHHSVDALLDAVDQVPMHHPPLTIRSVTVGNYVQIAVSP